MKIENLNRALSLSHVLKAINSAIDEAKEFLAKRNENAFGDSIAKPNNLFNLHISEWQDNSGLSIDLCNCGVGVQVIQFILEELQNQKLVIEKEIESL
jgi:hypothetical protein